MVKAHQSFVSKVLPRLACACYRRPRITLAVAFLLFAASLFVGATQLKLKMDWTYLFSESDPVVADFEQARASFPYPGDIAVLVDHGEELQREAFLELLAKKLAERPEVFHHVFYKLDIREISTRALYFLEPALLKRLEEVLESLSQDRLPRVVSDDQLLEFQLKLLDDLKTSLLTRGRFDYQHLWEIMTSEGPGKKYLDRLLQGQSEFYLTLANGDLHVLLLKSGTRNAPLSSKGSTVVELRKLLEELTGLQYGLRVRVTGLPVMLYDEKKTCTEDSVRSAQLSIAIIVVVFGVGFGGLFRPLMAVAALLVGLGWTLAYAALTVGHLNFITVSMVTMLMGLGIDFGIHLLFRFEEEFGSGAEPAEALRATLAGTGVDIFVGAAATAAAFLALTQAEFRGISDLGVIASGGVLLCFLSTVTVLPAFLALAPGQRNERLAHSVWLEWLEGQLLQRAKFITLVGALLIPVALVGASRVGFSYNLLDVQAQELASVQTEREMIADYQTTVLTGACVVENTAEARKVAARLGKLPSVAQVTTLATLLPENSPEKQALIERIVKLAKELPEPEGVPLERAGDLLALRRKMKEMEQNSKSILLVPEVREAVEEIKAITSDMQPGPIQDGLGQFQDKVIGDARVLQRLLKSQKAEVLTVEDLPDEMVLRSVSPEGKHLLNVLPAKNIWQRENLEQFLAETADKDHPLVGHPVVQGHILDAFHRAFKVTPWYTLLGVMGVLFVYLRRPLPLLLSLMPTAVGVLVIFATMGFVGMEFNVVNFVALPISVGIGAVYGVHAFHRMRELGDETVLSSSTGPALILSGITTIAGFASLMTAHHRGLASLGFVISVGVAANFVVSLVFLPALRRTVRTWGQDPTR